MNKRKIIENTNFKKASDLSGHDVNTYIASGKYSIACSEPEKIEDFNLLHFLDGKDADTDTDAEKYNEQFVSSFSENVVAVFIETSSDTYKRAYRTRIQEHKELEEFPMLFSIIRMKIFRELTGMQWLISY